MVRVTLSLILLIAATACFIAAAFGWGRGVSVGLACFSGAFVAEQLTA